MPLYDYRCGSCGSGFEAFGRVGAGETAPCPDCRGTAERAFSATRFNINMPYDQAIHGQFPTKHLPDVVKRQGGGVAIKNKETGGYRPALTHNTRCPKEGKWRNVAVLGEFPYGLRLVCEACDGLWIYNASLTDVPLNSGVDESLRPPRTIHMSAQVPLHSGYVAPERGA